MSCPPTPHIDCNYCPATGDGWRAVIDHVREDHPEQWTNEDETVYQYWISQS